MSSLVVMGVSGCGKSWIGALVAARLGLPLIEGDDFHGEHNRTRMQQGQPLTDANRTAWLDRLGVELALHPRGAVITCSALRRAYRDQLRSARPGLRFAWLELPPEAARARVAGRAGHFFPPSLVSSQFDDLEPPIDEPGVLRLDAESEPAHLVERVVAWWRAADASAGIRRGRPSGGV
jgi:gluconokinase